MSDDSYKYFDAPASEMSDKPQRQTFGKWTLFRPGTMEYQIGQKAWDAAQAALCAEMERERAEAVALADAEAEKYGMDLVESLIRSILRVSPQISGKSLLNEIVLHGNAESLVTKISAEATKALRERLEKQIAALNAHTSCEHSADETECCVAQALEDADQLRAALKETK